jgi:hypothetical protein
LLASALPLEAQNYLNLRYTDGSDKNVPFASLQRITFDQTNSVYVRMTDATTQTIVFSELQKMSFSETGAGSLLPVELVSFTATAEKENVILSWQTATETKNYGFEIERAIDNGASTPSPKNGSVAQHDWVRIGFVEGNGTTNAPKSYSFTDKTANGKISYRLKQIDRDGKFEYSQTVEVNVSSAPLKFNLAQNFPNPFNPSTTLAYTIATESFVTIKVYDIVGREVTTLVNERKKEGRYEDAFDGSHISSGVYICKMAAASYTSLIKMIITK